MRTKSLSTTLYPKKHKTLSFNRKKETHPSNYDGDEITNAMWHHILDEINSISHKVKSLSKTKKSKKKTEPSENESFLTYKSILEKNYEAVAEQKPKH